MSKEGEMIYLKGDTEERDLVVVKINYLKWKDQCLRYIGRASGVMRKLKTYFIHMDVQIFIQPM